MATITDYARVTAHLVESVEGEHVETLFDTGCDAFMAMCEEQAESDNGGSGFRVDILTQGSQNANPRFALAGLGSPGRYKMTLQPVNIEWKARWSRDAQLGAETKGSTAMFDLAKEEIMVAQEVAKQQLGKTLAGKGWGSLAGIVAISGADVTIGHPDGNASGATVKELTNRFYPGQIICSADEEGSGSLRGSSPGTGYTVLSVNRNTGVITFTATVSDFVDGDYLSEYGFRPYTVSGENRACVVGLEGWLNPTAAVSGDLLGGQTRYQVEGLEPIRYDASVNATISDGLIAADEFAFSNGKPRENLAILISPQQFRQLTQGKEAQAQVIKDGVTKTKANGEDYEIGFSSYQLQGMGSRIPVIPSVHVRPGLAFLGPFKDKRRGFKMKYAGKALSNITVAPDGNAIFMVQAGVTNNSSVVEAGFGVDGFMRLQLVCNSPNSYCVITGLGE